MIQDRWTVTQSHMYMEHAAVSCRASQSKMALRRQSATENHKSYPLSDLGRVTIPSLILDPFLQAERGCLASLRKDVKSSPAAQSSWAGTKFICLERSVLSPAGRRAAGSGGSQAGWGPSVLSEGLVGIGGVACSVAGSWAVSSGHLGRYQAGWPMPKSLSQSGL